MKTIAISSAETDVRLGVITSRFNHSVTERLFAGAKKRLSYYGVPDQKITAVWVPGAVEVPLVAKTMAKSKQYDAIICLGAVIRGETSHYDYVCQQVSDGCARVAYEFELPVVFGILTTETVEQALARSGGGHSHVGESAVDTALEMISVLNSLD